MIQVIRSGRYLMRTRRVDNNEFAEICRLVGPRNPFIGYSEWVLKSHRLVLARVPWLAARELPADGESVFQAIGENRLHPDEDFAQPHAGC
jgi:hypothetical protein